MISINVPQRVWPSNSVCPAVKPVGHGSEGSCPWIYPNHAAPHSTPLHQDTICPQLGSDRLWAKLLISSDDTGYQVIKFSIGELSILTGPGQIEFPLNKSIAFL